MSSIKTFFFLTVAFCFHSCAKDTKPFKKVEYQVVVYPGNEVGITYNSDFNVDNNTKKEFIINDENNNYTGNIWSGVHIQQGDEPYYIRVEYKQYYNPLNFNYGVFIFVNDTLKDQHITNESTPAIELTGSVF